MAVFNEPAQWDHTLGNNADASTLPDDSAATAGTASLQKLFQLINATPLEAGGIAPDREDVNALFKYLGDSIFYTMNGGVPSYNAAYDYVAGRVVLYNDNIYKCIQANGVSSTVVTPDSDTAYWQRLDNFVRSVNGVNADAGGNVSIISSGVEWIRFSDGTQICAGGTTLNGTIRQSGTFPMPFISKPVCAVASYAGEPHETSYDTDSSTNTTFVGTTSDINKSLFYIAFGRWK